MVMEEEERLYLPQKKKKKNASSEDDEEREKTIESGSLIKAIMWPGGGDSRPSDGDQVIYHCTVRTLVGLVIESTRLEHEGKGIPVRQVLGKSKMISGLLEGIPTMLKGEIALFEMKPNLHYGEDDCPVSASSRLPKEDELHFEIELVDFFRANIVSDDMGIIKKVITEGQGWESPREPYEVKAWISANTAEGKVIVPRSELEPFCFTFGKSEIPKGLEMGIGTMSMGEKAVIFVTSQYLTESSFMPTVEGLEEVYFDVELDHFTQVQDMLGDGRLIKRCIRDGKGEYPMDCPPQDSLLRLQYKGMLPNEENKLFYDSRNDNSGLPLEFSLGEGLVPEGFEMCVRSMLPGEVSLVTCPPDYAYNKFPRPVNVPEGACVSWEIELLGFETPKEWTGMDFKSIMDDAEKARSTMEEVPLRSDQVLDSECLEIPMDGEGLAAEIDDQNGDPEVRKEFVSPAIGMEFDSYEDAYNYYICYAKELGFRVRVKNSWFKRNSREKYGAVLCCSSQGFKRIKDVNRLRKETRTGCPAMMRMRLVDSKRWRVLEVSLDHNHLLGAKVHKSLKKTGGSGSKRNFQSSSDVDARTVKLYKPLVVDSEGNETSTSNQREVLGVFCDNSTRLNLKKGDTQALYNYLCRMQLTNPNFFYSVDISDEGRLRNIFWVDARSRAACAYFSDVVCLDNTYISNSYEIPLVAFVGTSHHGRPVLLGCGLLSGETHESYAWLFKAWLSSAFGNSVQTLITDRCKALQSAIAEVFPRCHHRFSLSHIMKKVPEKLGGLRNYDAIRKSLSKAVYESLKVNEFEAAWGFMIQRFGIADHEWLRSLYEDRAQWALVYLKDTFFAGMAASNPGENLSPFFDKYVHKQTPLKEFLDKYELALVKRHKEEAVSDSESRDSKLSLKTRCSFECQLSQVYTREIFARFQTEVEEMYSCFSTTQLHVDGPVVIFLVRERVTVCDGNGREIRDYEVLFNQTASEVRCICSLFNFRGYLCRHALCVLNFNGVEEVPPNYVLSRWKRDYKRLHIANDRGSNGADVADRFGQLYRSALQIVEEGVISLDHYHVALQTFEESLKRVHDVEHKHSQPMAFEVRDV